MESKLNNISYTNGIIPFMQRNSDPIPSNEELSLDIFNNIIDNILKEVAESSKSSRVIMGDKCCEKFLNEEKEVFFKMIDSDRIIFMGDDANILKRIKKEYKQYLKLKQNG
jgi:hypothetical protein